MQWARFFFLFFLVPILSYASFTSADNAKCVEKRVVEWKKHEELLKQFYSLSLSDQQKNIALLEEAIACCKTGIKHCEYLTGRINHKSKRERRSTYWSGERNRCEEDKTTFQKEIGNLWGLISHTHKLVAFDQARSLYQLSEQKKELAKRKEKECPRLLDNEHEVVRAFDEVSSLYEEAGRLAKEAFQKIAPYSDKESEEMLRVAMLSYESQGKSARKSASEWPGIVYKERLAVQAKLDLEKEQKERSQLVLREPLNCKEFQEREQKRREHFYASHPISFVENPVVFNSSIFPMDGYVAKHGNTFTLYQEQLYRFFVPIKTFGSKLHVKMYRSGELITEESLTLPMPDTPLWERYLTEEGMALIPDTKLRKEFGLDLRLQFVFYPESPFSLILSARGVDSQYQCAFFLDEEPLCSCSFVTPPPWQLGRLRKPLFTRENTPLPKSSSPTNPPFSLTLPTLASYPLLDQLVEELKADPLALASYVHHEIALADPFLPQENGIFYAPSIHRNALRTYLDRKGSPWELCQLLVHLLRQSGYPALYAVEAISILPKTFAEKLLFTKCIQDVQVKYPWVIFHDGKEWISLFPWMKEFHLQEGFDLYSLMPEKYASAERWIESYLEEESEGSAGDQFIRTLQNELRGKGLSLSDVGRHLVPIKRQFSSWSDFPRPFFHTEPVFLSSLQEKPHLFARARIDISSHEHPEKKISYQFALADIKAPLPIWFSEKGLHVKFNEERVLALDGSDRLIDFKMSYEVPLGSQVFSAEKTLSMRTGTRAALSFHFGGRTPDFTSQVYEQFSLAESDHDKQQALLGFVGASYFDKCGKAEEELACLHKVHPVTAMAFGLSKFSTVGEEVRPQVDMLWFYTKPAYGADMRQYQALSLLNLSSWEHEILREVFHDDSAISTVKLLQLAHKKNGGYFALTTDSLSLAAHMPEVAQTCYFPHLKGCSLKTGKEHPSLQWNIIQCHLGKEEALHHFARAYMTPGAVTSDNGAYTEMGTLLFHPTTHYALISNDNQIYHGGLGSPIPRSFFTSSYIRDWQLVPQINRYGTSSYSLTLPKAPEGLPFFSGKTKWAADVRLEHKSPWNAVADPVDVVTGAFYIDEIDLVLPGPFPLQIRRNYSSQNPHVGALGIGWKFSLNPFLIRQEDKLYAAEADGTVIVYSYNQETGRFEVSFEENPDLYNFNRARSNPFQSYIENDILYSADGSQRVFENGHLLTWKDARGSTLTFSYKQERLSRIESSSGDFCNLHYNHEGKISEIYAKDGRRIAYNYNAVGDLIQVILPNTAQISYEYDEEHRIIRETKPDGNVLENSYENGQVVEQRSPMGCQQAMIPTARFEYQDNLTKVMDASGGTTIYKIFEKQIHTIIDPLGYPTLQSWFVDDERWFDPVTAQVLRWELPGAFGRSLKSVTDKRGLVTSYLYDSFGNLVQMDQDLLRKHFIYNEHNLCIEETVLDQRTLTTYDPVFSYLPSLIATYRGDSLLAHMAYEYNAAGQLTKQDQSGSITLFTYDSRGFPFQKIQCTNTEDPDVITTYSYNPQGKCIAISSSDSVQKNSYDIMGNQIESAFFSLSGELLSASYTGYTLNQAPLWKRTANPNNAIYFDYHASGRVKAIEHQGAYTLYDYDSRGYLIQEVNPCGYVTDREYDAIGRIITETKGGLSTHFTYEPGGLVSSTISPSGAKKAFAYTKTGLLSQETYPDGTCHAIFYDEFNRPIRDTNDSITTEITYDDPSHKITRSYEGSVEISEYDARGNLIRFTDANGATSLKTYDGLNRIKTQTSPSGSTTAWNYLQDTIVTLFPNGEKQVQRHEGGRIVGSTLFNASGDIISTTSLHYDPETDIQQVSEGEIVTTTSLNSSGLPLRIQKGDIVTTYEYDLCGHCTSLIDGEGKVTYQFFDALGRLVNKQLTDGSVISYLYDSDSHLTEYHLPNQTYWKASYDCMGRRLSEHLQSGDHISQSWQYSYEGNLLTSAKDPLGRLHVYNYDSYGNLLREAVDGYERLFTYDLCGNLLSAEQIDPVRSLWGFSVRSKIERGYDDEGRIIGETISLNSVPIQMTTQLWEPSKRSLSINNHTRDFLYQNNQLIEVSTPETRLSYTYDLSGALIESSSPLTTTTRSYNASCLPSTLVSNAYEETLSWTSSGKLANYSSPSHSDEFTYTRANRLHTTATASYDFLDGVRTKAPNHTVSSLDAFGRVTAELLGETTQTTVYNAMGQVVTQGSSQFEWDPWGRLRKITTPTSTWTAVYDPLGRRLQAQYSTGWFSTSTSTYFYDPEEEFQAIGEQTDDELFWKIYGPKSCDAITDSTNKTAFLLYNTLGHLTSILSDTIESLPPTPPYGPQSIPRPTSLLSYAQSLTWHGQSPDSTGLICLGERYYDPQTGRFLSPDPLGYPPCFDLYAYADGDPINYRDLDGRFASAAYDTIASANFFTKSLVMQPLVKGLNQFSAHRANNGWTKSLPFSVGSFDLQKGAIGFINGINNTGSDVLSHVERLSQYAGGAKIHGIYSATNSLVLDVLEAKMVQLGYKTPPVYRLKEQWAQLMETQGPDTKFLQICHSGGCGILRNALEASPQEVRDRIIVLAIAPSVIIPKSLCHDSNNYVSERDFVSYLDKDGLIRHGKELQVLEAHPNADMWDHSFQSPTFEKKIQDTINNYKDLYGSVN